MGGRIYDPTLGRFMQADPFVHAPLDSQSYNHFAYVRNNPMSYTDPSGFSWWSKTWKKIRPFVGLIAMAIPGIREWALAGPGHAFLFGAAAGGVTTGTLKGALIDGFSSLAFQQIGSYFRGQSNWNQFHNANAPDLLQLDLHEFGGNMLTSGQIAGQIASHAATGGVIAVVSGGKFGHGFVSAGFTKGIGTPLSSGAGDGMISGTVASMVIGGTASVISGGKFANGARTAAYQFLFNGWASKVAKKFAKKLWTITPAGTSKVMRHSRFGQFYKSSSDGLWWSKDLAGHGKSAWKVFEERADGLHWMNDADEYGNFIFGKHKSAIGQFVPFKQLSTISGWEKAVSMSLVIGITALEVIDPTTYIMSPPQDTGDRLPKSNGGD